MLLLANLLQKFVGVGVNELIRVQIFNCVSGSDRLRWGGRGWLAKRTRPGIRRRHIDTTRVAKATCTDVDVRAARADGDTGSPDACGHTDSRA